MIRALAKVGVTDIGDPKQADFVTMAEQKAFEGRIFYTSEDIVAMVERAVDIMFARYAWIRKKRAENGDKDMKKYYEYGLEPYFLVCDEYNALCAMLDFQTRQRLDNAMSLFLLLGRQAGCFGILAMQKPAREDLGSKLQANINFRISVGRLDEISYDLTFGDVNRNKEFKYVKFVGGKRVYGRGYACVYGEVAREFYSPLLEKKFSFYDEFEKIERRENPFNPLENPEAVLSEEEKQVLQEEMQAKEELDKGNVKKASPELVQELLSSKQKENEENDVPEGVYLSDFALEKGVRSNILRNVIQKIEEQGTYSFERKEGKIFIDKDSEELLSKMIDDREESNKSWSELVSEYFGD